MVGSLEFCVSALKTRCILVMGHTECLFSEPFDIQKTQEIYYIHTSTSTPYVSITYIYVYIHDIFTILIPNPRSYEPIHL